MAHDFNLHAPEGANKKKKMLGRGRASGRGTTSGKGNKGQQARSGGKTYPGFEGGQMPLYRRLAQRGFSNYPFKKTFQIVNISQLEKFYNDGETVDEASLHAKGLIKGSIKNGVLKTANPVKILGNGDITKKIKIIVSPQPAGCAISGSVKEKIQKAGGETV